MFFRKLNWNVVGWFRTVSLISYVVIALGIASMVFHVAKGQPALQLGLSFTGGTSVDVTYQQPVTLNELRNDLIPLNLTDETIRTVGSAAPNGGYVRYSIETNSALGNNAQDLWSALGKAGTVDRAKSQISSVGPTLGREYLTNAVIALVVALVIQFGYSAFRFGMNYIFGTVVVIALVRDAAMMIGIYALAGRRADDAFLAAVLTVIGYSVMDTIVILDRIRENTKVMAGQAYDKIVNTSILQTMTRSFNTLATVVITLVALLALGGASLKNFAFALLVGICSGGYHSIFYSAPLVLVFRKRQLEAAARKRAAGLAATTTTRSARSVAESRALGSQSGAAREDILAARKARRQKAKSTRPPGSGPARYKRTRPEVESGTTTAIADEDAEQFDPFEEAPDQFDQGHEEITMNLDDFEPHAPVPPVPPAPDESEPPQNA
ncbi:MAG TPA: protein translocase subunit SecF [Candidatus Baltobacteraceae bacterium]|nr:protein translocase subunit SecF [Candidatus Baltobacteraceae bacterium]